MAELWRSGAARPTVSICIPTLDAEQPHVAAAVDAIDAHTSGDYEIVIFDCGNELLGYTAPQNAAVAASSGRLIVALNDDVIVSPRWFSTLLQALAHMPGALCATPDQTHTDGPQIFAPYCMLWTRAGWDQLGGLDEQFKLWCSDIDLARRLVDAARPPVRVRLPHPIDHALNFTTRRPEFQQQVAEMCSEDLRRFRAKWGLDAEQEKHRLAALV